MLQTDSLQVHLGFKCNPQIFVTFFRLIYRSKPQNTNTKVTLPKASIKQCFNNHNLINYIAPPS